MKRALPLVLLGLLVACAPRPTDIASFDECVLAGYPVMESSPRRCAVPDGPAFTEELPPTVEHELDDMRGPLLGVDENADNGLLTIRFRWEGEETAAILEPEAQISAMSRNLGPVDLRTVASGTFLVVQTWTDAEGILHAQKIRVLD